MVEACSSIKWAKWRARERHSWSPQAVHESSANSANSCRVLSSLYIISCTHYLVQCSQQPWEIGAIGPQSVVTREDWGAGCKCSPSPDSSAPCSLMPTPHFWYVLVYVWPPGWYRPLASVCQCVDGHTGDFRLQNKVDRVLLSIKTGVKAQLTKGKEKEIKLQVKSWHHVSLEAMIFTIHSTDFYISLQKQSLLTNGVSN